MNIHESTPLRQQFSPVGRSRHYWLNPTIIVCLAVLFFLAGCPVPGTGTARIAMASDTGTKNPGGAKGRLLQEGEAVLNQLKAEVEELRRKRSEKLAKLREQRLTEAVLERSSLEVESLKVRLQSLQLDLENENQLLKNSQAELVDIEQQLTQAAERQDADEIRSKLEKKKAELLANRLYSTKQKELLKRQLELVQQKLELVESWHKSVQAVFQKQQEIRQRESLGELERRLKEEQKKGQAEIDALRERLGRISGEGESTLREREVLNKTISAIQGGIDLLKSRVRLEELRSRYSGLKMSLLDLDSEEVENLERTRSALKQLKGQLDLLVELSRSRSEVYLQQWGLVQKQFALKNIDRASFDQLKKLLTKLIAGYRQLLEDLNGVEKEIREGLEKIETAYGSTVQKSLTARQPMPADLLAWRTVWAELGRVPSLVLRYLAQRGEILSDGWKVADLLQRMVVLLVSLAAISGAIWSRGATGRLRWQEDEELRLVHRARNILLELASGGIPVMFFGGGLIGICWVLGMAPDDIIDLFYLLLIVFIFGLALRVSRILFRSSGETGANRQLWINVLLVGLTIGGGGVAILEWFGNQGTISPQSQVVVDRFSMFLILLSVPLFFRLRRVFLEFVGETMEESVFTRLLKVMTLAIPLTGLVGGLVGLAGYINLAWFVTRQLVFFVGVTVCWGVVRDFSKLLLERSLGRLGAVAERHGLPREVVIRPIVNIVDLLFILMLLWLLAWIFGWDTGTAADGFLKILLGSVLFHLGGKPISMLEIGTALFLLLLFLYFGSLAKHFAFAVLYRKVGDRGLRNSLSVFTQYLVLVIGVLVSLNIVGINLSSLTVFAGALGVGIGFGLQNIANNLVSGFILLAERPVRVDDWVTVGDKEGVVSRIGLRSLKVNTWDNQDVIIPNADLITNPVTNWTLSDDLVRTILMVGISYQDDPHVAHRVIMDSVSMVPEVSLQKKPRVYLAEFADSSVNFRVEYYSSVKGQTGRWQTRSDVLFAIWDGLQDAGITIPFPQRDIHIKEMLQAPTPDR